MTESQFVHRFTEIAKSPDPDLAPAALFIARLEYPRLDAARYLEQLDAMGRTVAERIATLGPGAEPLARVRAISGYLFDDQGFAGNTKAYDDPRNSFLNQVLERRTGIPITLALVYIEVARRAGVRADGVNFPGHFLLRLPHAGDRPTAADDHVILDPFHGGAILDEADCQRLLRKHAGDDASFDRRLLARASKQQILLRMLLNLKRIYVRMRSFPQARTLTELLLALDPSALTELRDRGLLAYHLNDFSMALRDLEAYLRFTARGEPGSASGTEDEEEGPSEQGEHAEIWEHVKALRRRVASLN
ncbi:MAG: transglutaminase-like domain-containing protein [Acidobacteria bacterium]|nr:transglutaminase-like domain-containing protein [Acidobacteriota bacterium]